MADHTIVHSDSATDFMADYPGFGEMRSFTDELGAEQVAFTWRSMPPGTGGKGSYGHRHHRQEEVYFVIKGNLLFKLGDDVVEVGPRTAVRVPAHVYRSVHNDGPDEAELVICSVKGDGPAEDPDTTPDFWPE
jgi:mannose-6-phosphate isomerase-like protein (cupin superfamily)